MTALIMVYFNTYTSEAQTNNNILDTFYLPATLVVYGGELGQVRPLVDEFMALRESPNGQDTKLKAAELDSKINSLDIVKNYCDQQISTLDLALASDPYAKLQQICPVLKNLPFSKAADLFSKM